MTEIKKNHEIPTVSMRESEIQKLNVKLEAKRPQTEISPNEQKVKEADMKSRIMKALDVNRTETDEGSARFRDSTFTGNFESLMREQKEHLDKASKYEREANDLEKEIRRGKAEGEKMKEVRLLRHKAETEKREAEQCRQEARRELSFSGTEVSDVYHETDSRLNGGGKDISFEGYNGPCERACLKSGVKVGFYS